MKRTWRGLASVALVCFGWSFSSYAGTSVWVTAFACPNCSTALYQQAAISRGDGTWFIYDFPNNQLSYYYVWNEGPTYYAKRLAAPSDLQSYFNLARSTWAGNGGNAMSLEADISFSIHDLQGLPSRDTGMDAYAVVRSGYLQQDLSDCIQSSCFDGAPVNQTTWTNLVKMLQSTAGVIFNDNTTQVNFVIHLDNGSKVTFTWKNGDPAPKLISAVDANNNPIPMSPSQIVGGPSGGGQYVFNQYNPDLQSFINLVESYGATVSTQSGDWGMACTTVSGVTHCVSYLIK